MPRHPHFRSFASLPLAAALLTGCSLIPHKSAPAPEPPAPPPVAPTPVPKPKPAAKPILSVAQIVQILEEGAYTRAKTELERYLGKHPDDTAARSLLIQVSVDPRKALGEAHTLHSVERGETLSQIARKHLGSGMAFVLLARYNGIDRPRAIEIGQAIRIPNKPLGDLLKPKPTGSATVPSAPAPIAAVESGAWPPPADLPPAQLGERYRARIESLIQTQRYDEAVSTADQAATAQPAAGDWQWLPPLTRKSQSLRWQQQGLARMQGDGLDDHLAAYDAFGEALTLDPGLASARKSRSELRNLLVLDYHEAALVQYRNQQLDDALKLWDKALALDPNFEPAQGYRLRVLELKRRLESLQPTDGPARP